MPTHEIVIGIDFGTTYSGVSWARNAGRKDVRVITDWPQPGYRNSNAEKVPSCISYKDGRPDKYGYLVGHEDISLKGFKLLLNPFEGHARDLKVVGDNVPPHLCKKTLEVVTDYLKWLWTYAWNDITRHVPSNVMNDCELRVVLTAPAIWNDQAKDQILQAARAAGMPPNIKLVTEPEAAALAVLREKAELGDLKIGECYVICDAGGGTVDLISYRIEHLDPLQVKEITIGSGDHCGSYYLDIGFEKYVSIVVGEEKYGMLPLISRKRMIEDFEHGVKRRFGDRSAKYSVELKGIKSDPENEDIVDDAIQIKRNNLKPTFDEAFNKIQFLVRNQIKNVKKGGNEVQAILLVGGLGESKYLYDRLKAGNSPESAYEDESDAMSEATSEETMYSVEGTDGIDVIQDRRAWSAVCRGATLWGLESSPRETFLSRRARCSYGISINNDLDRSNLKDKKVALAATKHGALRQMKWLLRRGEEYNSGHRRTVNLSFNVDIRFWNKGYHEIKKELFYCNNTAPPKKKDDSVKPLCVLKASVSYAELGQEPIVGRAGWFGDRRCVDFSIEVLFGDAILEFQMWYRNKKVGSVTAEYKDAS